MFINSRCLHWVLTANELGSHTPCDRDYHVFAKPCLFFLLGTQPNCTSRPPPPFAGDGGLRLSPGRWHVCGSKVCHFQTRPIQSAMLCDHYTRTIPRIQRMTEPQEGRSRDPGVSPRTRITWRCGVITVRPPSESETRRP